MILQRLYELAQREGLLEDPAFVTKNVACQVEVGERGEYLGLIDLRRREETPARRRGAPPRVRLVADRQVGAPARPVIWDTGRSNWKTTDPAAAGAEKPAVFLADVLPRALPIERLVPEKDRAKFRAQRSTFWRFIRFAATQTGDPALQALVTLESQLEPGSELAERLTTEVERLELTLSDLCTFAWGPDRGQVVLQRSGVRDWWRAFFDTDFGTREAGQYRGLCQVTQQVAAIAPTITSKVKGLIPIGCRADAYLVTGLAAAESYGLEGATAGMVSARAVDGFTRGLNALIGDELAGRRTSHRVGKVLFLFWTRRPADGIDVIFEPTEGQVKELLTSPGAGRADAGLEETDAFYLLSLTGNVGRVVVRDYLEAPLPRVRENLRRWFAELRIADASVEGAGHPTALFPLWQLVAATALDMDHVAPDIAPTLLRAALRADPLPGHVLSACLGRLRAEGQDACRPPLMALIKITLLRRNISVTETLDDAERNKAYICGRLLAVFEQIQYAALGDVNATVTDKYFGTFSAAPAVVLGRLYANAQNHLRKLRGDKPGAYTVLDKLLTEVSGLLPPAPPQGQLSLEDQGRFALGYYHQRARRFAEIAERKAARAATAS